MLIYIVFECTACPWSRVRFLVCVQYKAQHNETPYIAQRINWINSTICPRSHVNFNILSKIWKLDEVFGHTVPTIFLSEYGKEFVQLNLLSVYWFDIIGSICSFILQYYPTQLGGTFQGCGSNRFLVGSGLVWEKKSDTGLNIYIQNPSEIGFSFNIDQSFKSN